MATHVFVVDSSFRRTQIKVTPGISLREVLEEACKSRKLSPEAYTLKTQRNKIIDLSQPFRLSGLSAGAKLQLTQASKSPGVVSVALQLPEGAGGGRLSDKFPSTTSLWFILRKFEDAVAGAPATKLNLTQRGIPSGDTGAGRLLYEQPCVHTVGRNFETLTDLQKTLGQLGLNGGTALLRLNFRRSEQPLEEAMVEMSGHFSAIDSKQTNRTSEGNLPERHIEGAGTDGNSTSEIRQDDTKPASSVALSTENSLKDESNSSDTRLDTTQQPIETTSTDPLPNTTQPSELENIQPSEPENIQPTNTLPGISVYRPPTSNTPAAALQQEDLSIYEPTIDHAKAHLAELNRSGRPQRLPSDKELEEQQAQRQEILATIRNVIVRVRYPDQSLIETTVPSTETAADLYKRVADTISASPDEPFELRYTATTVGSKLPAHRILPRSAKTKLVHDCGFQGKVLLTFVWSQEASVQARKGPSLKEEFRQQATDLKVEMFNSAPERSAQDRTSTADGPSTGEDKSSGSGKKVDAEARMKRFLGLGKK